MRSPLNEFWFSPYPIGQPRGQLITLPVVDILSIEAIRYTDPQGAAQTLTPATDVQFDAQNGRLLPSIALSIWPQTQSNLMNAVEIDWKAGYASISAIPQRLTQALCMVVGHWFEAREEGMACTLENSPFGFWQLIDDYRHHPEGNS